MGTCDKWCCAFCVRETSHFFWPDKFVIWQREHVRRRQTKLVPAIAGRKVEYISLCHRWHLQVRTLDKHLIRWTTTFPVSVHPSVLPSKQVHRTSSWCGTLPSEGYRWGWFSHNRTECLLLNLQGNTSDWPIAVSIRGPWGMFRAMWFSSLAQVGASHTGYHRVLIGTTESSWVPWATYGNWVLLAFWVILAAIQVMALARSLLWGWLTWDVWWSVWTGWSYIICQVWRKRKQAIWSRWNVKLNLVVGREAETNRSTVDEIKEAGGLCWSWWSLSWRSWW